SIPTIRHQFIAALALLLLFATHVNADSRGGALKGRAFIDPHAPTDGTDATAAINSAIDAANAACGGVVYLAKGTYTIQGDHLPSQGAVVLKSNVCLTCDGPVATILQLKDHMGSDVTGLVRTPVSTNVSELCIGDLPIE